MSGIPGIPGGHHEIELNFVYAGSLTYLLGGSLATVPAGRLAMFWAACPHQLVRVDPGLPSVGIGLGGAKGYGTRCARVVMPLSRLLRWQLPESVIHDLLAGRMLIDGGGSTIAPAGLPAVATDAALFERWALDLANPDSLLHPIIALEVQARVRRFALASPIEAPAGGPAQRRPLSAALTKIQQMARCITCRYLEPITVADIAAAAGLHPNYAMTIFRKHCGQSLIDYVTQARVHHAMRLLATHDTLVTDIAGQSGFASVSRFYDAFTRACGQTPRRFRAALCREAT